MSEFGQAWQDYSQALPLPLHKVAERAFYAGALALKAMAVSALSLDEEDACHAALRSVAGELDQYAQRRISDLQCEITREVMS